MRDLKSSINWDFSENFFLCSNLSLLNKRILSEEFSNQIFINSSGSSSTQKVIAISKNAFLKKAEIVNNWISATKKDVWGNALPTDHVSGLSNSARAFVSGAKLFNYEQKWSALKYLEFIKFNKVSISSLVPTQLFDLVQMKVQSPESLRVLFVGGARLDSNLFFKAKELGWPVLKTFGMSEMSSQIATAELATQAPDVYLLPEMEIKLAEDSTLLIKGAGKLSASIYIDKEDVRIKRIGGEEYFCSNDIVRTELNAGKTRIIAIGRKDQCVKIMGELVNLVALNNELSSICVENSIDPNGFALSVKSSERKGESICLVAESSVPIEEVEQVFELFNKSVKSGVERADSLSQISLIPRTELGKLKYVELKSMIA